MACGCELWLATPHDPSRANVTTVQSWSHATHSEKRNTRAQRRIERRLLEQFILASLKFGGREFLVLLRWLDHSDLLTDRARGEQFRRGQAGLRYQMLCRYFSALRSQGVPPTIRRRATMRMPVDGLLLRPFGLVASRLNAAAEPVFVSEYACGR